MHPKWHSLGDNEFIQSYNGKTQDGDKIASIHEIIYEGIMFESSMVNQKQKRKENHPVFDEIRDSCVRELRMKGFETEVYLLPGGVGVKLLNSNHPSLVQIAHLPIIEFDFDYAGSPSIEHLAFFQLKGTRFSQSKLQYFSDLNQFSLRKLYSNGAQATDFESLSNHQLEELSLCKTDVAELNFLNCSPINSLFLSNSGITDSSFNSLKDKKFERLDLFRCEISDLSHFAGAPLEELNISGTGIECLSPLSSSPLRKLEMRATKVTDLSPLASCPLEILHLPGSPIKSLSPLAYCPIHELNIAGLEIDDFSPLLNMPLKKLIVSNKKYEAHQVSILEDLELSSLTSPGSPVDQKVEDFLENIANY